MYNCEISRFKVSAFTVVSSLTITILFILSSSTSINSQPENDSRSLSFDNKCADYHTSERLDAGIVVGGYPSGISVDPSRHWVYAVDSITKKISVVDSITDTLTKTISIANIKTVNIGSENRSGVAIVGAPGYIAIDPATNLLSVAITDSNFLYIFDAESGSLLSIISIVNRPTAIYSSNFVTQVTTMSTSDPLFFTEEDNSTLHTVDNYLGIAPSSFPEHDRFFAIDVLGNHTYILGLDALYEYERYVDTNGKYSFTNIYPFYSLESPDVSVDFAINQRTKIAYIIGASSNITALDLSDGKTILTNFEIPYNATDITGIAIVVSPELNIIYALIDRRSLGPSTVLAFDGDNDNCLLAEIPVGDRPVNMALERGSNMIYVTDIVYGTIWAINGATNNLTAVVRFGISPPNSGYIQCNEKRLEQNFTRYDVGTNLLCEAKAFDGYAFSSWSGDFVPIASKNPNVNSKESIGLKVSKYSSLNANFVSTNPITIPESFWAPLYGIIPAVVASTFIPSIIQWNRGKKLSKRHLDYYSSLIGETDHGELEKEIAQLYREGKINESDYGILKDRINNFQDRYDDNPAGVHTGSPFS